MSNQSLKMDCFKNITGKRFRKVLDTIDSLAKCANKNDYEHDEEDISKMMRALKDKVKIFEVAYTSNTIQLKTLSNFNCKQ